MDHCPSMMVNASGDRQGFLLILKMEIVNVFLTFRQAVSKPL